ncbi:MAG: nicotinamide riboside transporter PnuC [Bacteroidales bacterium]|nr:nicotinamide riboside transporter PnuC [Bacteroidales bacterium]
MDISWIDIATSAAGLCCVFLAGRGSRYNFWVGYLYTALLIVMFWQKNVYASLLLQPISLGINILGHYRWTHPRKGEESSRSSTELRVSALSNIERILIVGAVFLVAFLWGWMLEAISGRIAPDPVPYLDALVTILILAAQYLSAQKKVECWVLWILVNVTQLILHIRIGNIFMPVVCGLYLVNGIISFVNWLKMYRNKA